jgi:hypothetical protein
MATIVIKIDPKANQTKLIEAIEMFKGVKSVTVTDESVTEDEYLAKQMNLSRKSGKGNKDKILDFLGK